MVLAVIKIPFFFDLDVSHLLFCVVYWKKVPEGFITDAERVVIVVFLLEESC